jgi:uncharacterized protein (DUF983 family)
MTSSRQWTCPACHELLLPQNLKEQHFQCPYCGVQLGFSSAPFLIGLALASIASVGVVQFMNLKAYAALLWLPVLVLCAFFLAPLIGSFLATSVLSPLKVEPDRTLPRSTSHLSTLRLFIVLWIVLVLLFIAYGFLLGWVAFLLSGSRQEAARAADMFSFPLGLINRNFIIRPDRSLAEVIGIVTANCYFYALGLTIVFKVVHGFLSRSRVTQLGISGTTLNDDDELF